MGRDVGRFLLFPDVRCGSAGPDEGRRERDEHARAAVGASLTSTGAEELSSRRS